MVEQPGIGSYLMAGSPLSFSEHGRLPATAAPTLGEHTDEVLSELLALSDAEISRARRRRGRRTDAGRSLSSQLSRSRR